MSYLTSLRKSTEKQVLQRKICLKGTDIGEDNEILDVRLRQDRKHSEQFSLLESKICLFRKPYSTISPSLFFMMFFFFGFEQAGPQNNRLQEQVTSMKTICLSSFPFVLLLVPLPFRFARLDLNCFDSYSQLFRSGIHI